MRNVLSRLIVMLCCAAICPIADAATGLLLVDGRYYTMDLSPEVTLNTQARILTLPITSMANCRRPSGSPPAVGSMAMIFGASFSVLYTSVNVTISQTAPQIRLTTPTGDVVCDGAVPAPVATLFQSGFE